MDLFSRAVAVVPGIDVATATLLAPVDNAPVVTLEALKASLAVDVAVAVALAGSTFLGRSAATHALADEES